MNKRLRISILESQNERLQLKIKMLEKTIEVQQQTTKLHIETIKELKGAE